MGSDRVDQAMLMAAGLGTRLRPFTDWMPKPLLPLMGIPMAQYCLDMLAGSGVAKIVANIHHLPDIARSGFESLDRGGASLEISDESKLLLGSSGGIRKALPRFGGKPFFYLNSDVICETDLAQLGERHRELRAKHGVVMTLTVFDRGPVGGRYREIKMDAARERMTELGDFAEGRPYFVGVAVIEPEALEQVPMEGPSDFIQTMLLPAVAAGKVGIHRSSGEWHDVGSPELWLRAHLALIQRLEEGSLPFAWSRRIAATQRSIIPGIWASREASMPSTESDWSAPIYWNPQSVGMPGAIEATAPMRLGPGSVVYGLAPRGSAEGYGVGFNGTWTACPAVRPSSSPG